MSHLFSYPTATLPTATVRLNPALVTIQEKKAVRPTQRALLAPDGTRWVYQLSPNRMQTFQVTVDRLHEADSGIYAGYGSLYNFIDAFANFMMNQFDLTHTDGLTTPVWFSSESWALQEGPIGGGVAPLICRRWSRCRDADRRGRTVAPGVALAPWSAV